MNDDPDALTQRLATQLLAKRQSTCTAESCTGGLIAKTFTDLAGSSDWLVANAMASGALRHSAADYAVAVTGVAGPGGGSDEKPVGTVWIAVASKCQANARLHCFDGDRQVVREATLQAAIEALLDLVESA